MKTRNKLLTVLLAMIFAISLVTLAACDDAMHEHEYGAWEIVVTPTEDNEGKAVRKCPKDDATEELKLNVLTDSEFWTVNTIPARHGVAGESVYTVKQNTAVTVKIVLPAEPHSFGAWTLDPDNKPTKTTSGKAIRTCSANDGGSESKDIAKLTDTTVWTLSRSTPADHENDGEEVYVSEYGTVTVDILSTGHTFGAWTVDPENTPTETAPGKAIRTCTDDDGGKENKTIPALSDTTFWDSKVIPQSYSSAETTVYTAKDDADLTVSVENPDKPILAAPYQNKKYFAVTVDTQNLGTENNASHKAFDLSLAGVDTNPAFVVIDAKGMGESTSYPFQGANTLELVSAETGEIKWTNVNARSDEYTCFIDMNTGIIIAPSTRGNNKSLSDISIWTPFSYEHDVIVNVGEDDDLHEETRRISSPYFKGSKVSAWLAGTDRVIAIEYVYTDSSSQQQTLGILVKNNTVTFGVTFKNIAGAKISADNCHNAAQVYAYKDNEKIANFGYGFDGTNMRALDGNEGTYAASGDVIGNFVIDGLGNVTHGSDKGTYTVNDGTINATVGSYFYFLTLNKENKTCTAVAPKVTIKFDVDGAEAIADREYTAYVAADLPTPVYPNGSKLFRGWYLDGEFGEEVTEFIPQLSDDNITLYARWETKITINVVSDIAFDDYSATVDLAAGDVVTEMLPQIKGAYKDGYKFIDWYTDSDKTMALPESLKITEAQNGVTVYAKWEIAGVWNLQNSGAYGFVYDSEKDVWKSTNYKVSSSSSVMELSVVEGTLNVSFEYAASSEGGRYDIIQIVYYENASGTATSTDTDGNKVNFENLIWKSYTKDIAVGNKLRFDYKKDGSGDSNDDRGYIRNLVINGMRITKFGSPDFMNGVYKCNGRPDLVLDGMGSFEWGSNVGTYTKSDGETFDMYVVEGGKNKEYYILTLNAVDMTYSVEKPTVTVTFDYSAVEMGVDRKEVNKNADNDFPEELTATGYVFRGWYETADFAGEPLTSFAVTENKTFYAKYDRAVTLIYNLMVSGVDNHTVAEFENNKIGELYVIPDSVQNGDKVFVGWFTKDGTDSDWGEQVTVDTVITAPSDDAVMTVYAQWIKPNALLGVYKGYESWSTSSTSMKKMTIDVFGNVTWDKANGVITEYNETTNTFVIKSGNDERYAYYDANSKTIVTIDSKGTELSSDVHVLTLVDNIDVAVSSPSTVKWNSNKSQLIKFTVGGTARIFFVNGNDNKVYGDVTVKVNEIEINDLSKIKTKGNLLTVTAGSDKWELGYDGTNLVASNGTQGTYTCEGNENIFLNGVGNIVYGDKVGTLTAKDGGYTAKFSDATYTLTIDVAAKTYTLVDDKVTVSYNFGTLPASLDSVSVYSNVAFTLPTAPDISGYKFRGWYDNAEFSGSAKTSVTPSANMTVYAKYDKAIVITLINGNGMVDSAVNEYFANDNVSIDLPADANGFTAEGWYTNETFTNKWTSGSKVSDDLMLYCKWQKPHALKGIYKGVEFDSTALRGTTYGTLTIDALGNVTGSKNGKLTEVGNGVYKIDDIYMYYDAVGKTIVTNYGSSKAMELGTDLYVYTLVANADVVVSCAYSNQNTERYVVWDANKTKLGKVTVDSAEKFFFVYNNKVYGNVTVLINDAEIDNLSKLKTAGNVVLIKDVAGTQVYKALYNGTEFVFDDGTSGTYTNTTFNITSDGYGSLTIGEGKVSYTLNETGNLTFVYGSRMYVVSLDKANGTYTQVQDGYAGTYTLPDGAGTVIFDGLGGAGANATYVVNGAQVTVYVGGVGTNYGLDLENKALLGKSVFAGLTFSGKYYDAWDESNANLFIVFGDSSSIEGVMYKNMVGSSFYFNFTGELSGNILTLTFTKAVDSSAVSKTIILTINGDTMTIGRGTYSTNIYTFWDKGSVSCAGFSL